MCPLSDATDVPAEVDPESDGAISNEDDASLSVSEEDLDQAREHYLPVTESNLRKRKQADIDPRYRGTRIDRQALGDTGEEDDPFDGSNDFQNDESVETDDGVEDTSGDSDVFSDPDRSETEHTETSNQDEALAASLPQIVDKQELRRAMAADQSAITTSVLAAARLDAEKGRAAKRQRSTYESLLNIRIKMQKSLVAANSLVTIPILEPTAENPDLRTAFHQAEFAANALWSKLSNYREELLRDHSVLPPSTSTPTDRSSEVLVRRHQQAAAGRKGHHDAVLQKWSLRTRSVTAGSHKSRINTEQPASIVDVLNEHLSNNERLMQRARTPRSCAPIQLADRVLQDDRIYDDADLYGLLLKELLETRTAASSTAAASIDVKSFVNIRREAKTRKNVDTKASKGRKLKYTIHEKLQNFCAPDDRTSWTERQRDELFSSLFGQRLGLQEEQDGDAEESDDEVTNAGLMLFRS